MTAPKGPRDRNYTVQFMHPTLKYYYGAPNGTISQVSRSASLTVNNPYRAAKPPGLRPPTARSLTHERIINGFRDRTRTSGTPERFVGPGGAASGTLRNHWIGYTTQMDAVNEQLRTEAILQALSAVKDQKWNAGVMLAESRGVATMAMDLMSLVARTRTLLRKGDFRAAYRNFRKAKPDVMSYPAWKRKHWAEVRHVQSVRTASKIPQGWLYYHFGIKPTINDISSAVDDFVRRKAAMAYEYGGIARGYARHTIKQKGNLQLYNYTPCEYGDYDHVIIRSVRVAIGVRPKPSFIGRLSTLGITNPPEAIYNGLPFSWLLDYFTSFGDWLGALDSNVGYIWDTHWTEAWRTTYHSTFNPRTGPGVSYAWPIKPDVCKRKVVNRVVRGDLYGPMGSILPQMKRKGPSVQQYSNLLSVVSTMFSGTIRP